MGRLGRIVSANHLLCARFLPPCLQKSIALQPPISSRPSTPADITALSLHFLRGEVTSYPFSPAPLSIESQLILPHLLRLAKNGWWLVGSQPAVDGLESDHSIVGWGPAGGYVYQKSFVEFFASEEIVEKLKKTVEKTNGVVNFLAGNKMVRSQPPLVPSVCGGLLGCGRVILGRACRLMSEMR